MRKLIVTLGLFTGLLSFGQNNMLDTSSWTVGSGSVTGFNRNGTDAENIREMGTTPYGVQDVLWKAFPDGVTSNSHGGWNTANIPIDHTKTYRYSVWMKKTNSINGSEVFGVDMSDSGFQNALLKLDGTSGGNGIVLSSIPDLDKWYLCIGYVYNSSYTGTVSEGGIYDPVTGNKVSNGTDYKSTAAAVTTKHKAYLWNAPSTSDALYFYGPTLYEMNGLEPTIQDLLNGSGGSDTEAPTPPSLTSDSNTDTTVNLSWSGATDNVGVTSYKVYKDGVLEASPGNIGTSGGRTNGQYSL